MKFRALTMLGTLAAALLAIAAFGCQTTPTQDAASDAAEQRVPTEVELIKGPVSADGLQAIFATPDLAPGEQRIAVVLTS